MSQSNSTILPDDYIPPADVLRRELSDALRRAELLKELLKIRERLARRFGHRVGNSTSAEGGDHDPR